MLRVDRIVQFSPLCRDMNAALDNVHTFLEAFPGRRNRLPPTGVDIAIYPFGEETFMEVIVPYDSASAAWRLLERSGEGWFMLNVDLQVGSAEEAEQAIKATGARIASGRANSDGSGAWHLHPRDACGVLLALYMRPDKRDHTDWGGLSWRHFEATNRRVVNTILGASLATPDMDAAARLYTAFGFAFGPEWEDSGDRVRQADCPGGTFLQLRTPTRTDSPSAAWLDRHGEGLFHLALGAANFESVHAALGRVGGKPIREAEYGGQQSLWASAERAFGMPLEFRLHAAVQGAAARSAVTHGHEA